VLRLTHQDAAKAHTIQFIQNFHIYMYVTLHMLNQVN
jgi:hypothetical protein